MTAVVGRENRFWLAFIWAAGGLVLFYAAFLTMGTAHLYLVANQIGPILLSASCLTMVYALIRLQPLAIWSALPWFLAVYALYYGFGPLVYIYGLEESVTFMETLYVVGPHDLLRTNLLNSVALLSVNIGVLSLAHIVSHWIRASERSSQEYGVLRAACAEYCACFSGDRTTRQVFAIASIPIGTPRFCCAREHCIPR